MAADRRSRALFRRLFSHFVIAPVGWTRRARYTPPPFDVHGFRAYVYIDEFFLLTAKREADDLPELPSNVVESVP